MNIHHVYRVLSLRFREKRMRWFQRTFKLDDNTTILDVGGSQYNWKFLSCRPKVTIVNIFKPRDWDPAQKNFAFEIGDATQLRYADHSFDIVYSNSVIEHVGSWDKQIKFAKEVHRVGRSYYVQTPAREFIIEPHFMAPAIHWLPPRWQRRLLRNFSLWGLITRPSPERIQAVLSEIRLLTSDEFKRLFPEAEINYERFLLTK